MVACGAAALFVPTNNGLLADGTALEAGLVVADIPVMPPAA